MTIPFCVIPRACPLLPTCFGWLTDLALFWPLFTRSSDDLGDFGDVTLSPICRWVLACCSSDRCDWLYCNSWMSRCCSLSCCCWSSRIRCCAWWRFSKLFGVYFLFIHGCVPNLCRIFWSECCPGQLSPPPSPAISSPVRFRCFRVICHASVGIRFCSTGFLDSLGSTSLEASLREVKGRRGLFSNRASYKNTFIIRKHVSRTKISITYLEDFHLYPGLG